MAICYSIHVYVGAEFVVDANAADIVKEITLLSAGGSHGVLCIAPHAAAFKTAVAITRPHGTAVLIGLPPTTFDCPIVDVILKAKTIRGSIVGTRQDIAEAMDFAARGLVKCDVELAQIDDINDVIQRLRREQVQGRIVVQFSVEEKGTKGP